MGSDLLQGHPAPDSPLVGRSHPGPGPGPAASAPVSALQRLQIGGASPGALPTSGSVQLPKLGMAVGGSGNLSNLGGGPNTFSRS
jgi:hypothetical protein